MTKTLSLLLAGVAIASLSTGCTVASKRGQITDSAVPGLPNATFKIVEKVEGSGQASMFSPSVAQALKSDGVVELATKEAMGTAIYDNNEIDLIIAPKVSAEVIDLGIWAQAKVQVKGVGVKITGPK